MKRTIKFVLGFGLLGALTGACMPLVLGTRDAVTYGLPYWVDDYFNPVVVLLGLTIPCGFFVGALTGLASAFSRGRFATVRSLLTITIPSLFAMMFFTPPRHTETSIWTPYLVGAVVATAIAILLAYLGHQRMRSRGTP